MRRAYVHGHGDGPTVVVTGCSSGFGAATARRLVERGYRVVATARRPEALEDLQRQTREGPGRLVVRQLDVTSAADVHAVIGEAAERGDLEAVVNNAGVASAGFIDDLSAEDFREVMETNFYGAAEVARASLAHLRARRRGTIVQMSSGGGRFGLPMLAPYAVSKHALEGYSEVLRHEAAPWGVRVVLLEPGAFKTRMHLGERRLIGLEGENGRVVQALAQRVHDEVEKRGGEPEVVARAVLGAIEHPHPRLRRPVGVDAWAMLAVKRFLPFAVLERFAKHLLDSAGYRERVAMAQTPGLEERPGDALRVEVGS